MPVSVQSPPVRLRLGKFQLDPDSGELHQNGHKIPLTPKAFELLRALVERPGQVVTREELRAKLWAAETFVEFDDSLNHTVKRLRLALGDSAENPQFIETLPRYGYRFIAKVETPHAPESPMPLKAAPSRLTVFRQFVLGAALLAALYIATKPVPVPRIVGSHALTKTGFRKARLPKLVTDGKSIYFQEQRPSGLATMQVGVSGGELSQVSVSAGDATGSLRDISKDGSQLLLSIFDPKANHYDAWIQPLPAGPTRRIVKDARWSVWSADGRSLFFIRDGTELYRANADGTDAHRLAVFTEITDIAVSPNGKHLRFVTQNGDTLVETDADGANPHPVLSKPGGVYGGSWSPDGRFYFFKSWSGERFDLWAIPERGPWWSGKTPTPIQLTFGPVSFYGPVRTSGKHMYSVGVEHHGELSVYDPESGQFVPYLSGLAACFLDFSRDGRWIVYVSFPDGNLWRSRIDGTERMQLTAPPFAVVNPRWSPDGKLIVFTDMSGGDRQRLGEVSNIYVANAEGGEPMLLVAGSPIVEDPNWSADGKAVVYGVMKRVGVGYPSTPIEIRILDLKTQKSTKVPGSESLWSPRWSPDGKYLVALAGWPASRLMIFSFATQTWKELESGTFIGWASWSRDSKYVFAMDNWQQMIRITASTHKKEQVAKIGGLRSTAYYLWGSGWYGVTPDGKPITTRDTSLDEIYDFDLEYK